MRFGELLSVLPSFCRSNEGSDGEITALCTDSRCAAPHSLFICLRGESEDGHMFACEAYERGCRFFVCEHTVCLPPDAAVAYVPDSRRALAALAAAFYRHPARDITLIGITGTKGKTTVALLLYRLLSSCGVRAGYIGSSGVGYGGIHENTCNTTPSSLELARILADMRAASVEVAVLEISSQAIARERIAGLSFPICIFTNLANDHIGEGEHPDFAHYRETKARLFSDYGCQLMVFYADDPTASYMIAGSSAKQMIAASLTDSSAPFFASHLRPVRTEEGLGTAFRLKTEKGEAMPVFLPLPGECNVSNALLALAAAQGYLQLYRGGTDASLRRLAPLFAEARIQGRFESVKTAMADVDFIIDYAHNGYSMAAALSALRAYEPKRILCLFGSVGGRTYTRRAELAEAAASADFCIVTADNPDTEPPEDTMREICAVLEEKGCEYVAIPDRAAAIRYAVSCARPGDTVLLAGKGHEDYQLVNGRRLPFSEREILLSAVQEHLAAAVSVN